MFEKFHKVFDFCRFLSPKPKIDEDCFWLSPTELIRVSLKNNQQGNLFLNENRNNIDLFCFSYLFSHDNHNSICIAVLLH